jgi:hypothetical protein
MGSESRMKEKRRESSLGDEGERKRRKTSDKEEKTHKSKTKHKSQDSSKHKSSSKHTKSNDDNHKKHDSKSKFVIKEISVDDYFSKNTEFSTWLKEKKDVFFSDLSAESARDLFSKFVKIWNKQKLDSRYYEGTITAAPRSSHKWNIKS